MRYANVVKLALVYGVTALALPAQAGPTEGTATGGSGAIRVKGEGEGFRIATPKAPVKLLAKGAGDLSLKLRAVLPAGSLPSDGAKVRILDNGTELAHLSLSIYPAGAFSDHADVLPGGPSARSFHLGEGNHLVTVETHGGSAAVSLRWKPKHHRANHSFDAIEPAPELAAAPLSEAPPQGLVAAPLSPPSNAAPLVATPPAPKPSPVQLTVTPPPEPAPEQVLIPYAGNTQPAVATVSDNSRSPLPLIFVSAAVLCAVGSGVSVGLAVSQDGSYASTPENHGSVPTNRGGMLSTANSELAVGEVLGAAAAALLLATGVSLLF